MFFKKPEWVQVKNHWDETVAQVMGDSFHITVPPYPESLESLALGIKNKVSRTIE